jgi:hypothetical protein
VSFRQNVLPVLERLSNLQWVNKGFSTLFGHGAPFDFTDKRLLEKLSHRPVAGRDDTHAHLRRTVFNAFRAAINSVYEPRTWPWLYGDSFGEDQMSARDHLAPSANRSQLLQRWVLGEFDNDWLDDAGPAQTLDQVPLAQQPAMLDRAALDYCLADAFHPGIELSWPMRHLSIYRAPFRIKTGPVCTPERSYGDTLDQPSALAPDGPLHEQRPGGLSRWMALPWQVDTVGCRSGYEPKYDPYLPTFWPARVPDHVLSAQNYAAVMNTDLPRERRLAAFNQREHWDRLLTGSFVDKAMQVVTQMSDRLGTVHAQPGLEDDPDFPSTLYVESLARSNATAGMRFFAGMEAEARSASDLPDYLTLAGWECEEQFEEFRRILKRS